MNEAQRAFEDEVIAYLTTKLGREPTMGELDNEIYEIEKEYNWIKYPKQKSLPYCECGSCEECDWNQ